MPPLALKPYNLTDPETGNTVAVVPPAMIQQYNQSMNGAPGAGAWGTFGDALQIGAGIIEAGDLKDLRNDIRDSRRRLQKRRDELDKYYKSLGTSGVAPDFGKIADLSREVWEAQDDVDRDQTRAIGTIQDNILINVAGAGARVVGRMQGGNGGGYGGALGSGDVPGLILAGGVGALLWGALDDDDGGAGAAGAATDNHLRGAHKALNAALFPFRKGVGP